MIGGQARCTDISVEESARIVTNKTVDLATTRTLAFDWDKVWIGSAQYPEGPTGCTVFRFPDRNVRAVVDIRGSAAASIFTNDLVEGMTALDAIVLAGGSLLGLEAATGVSAEIFKERGLSYGWGKLPLVAGSILFDWIERTKSLYPDKALGAAAYKAAQPGTFLLGRHGAGTNTYVAKLFGNTYMVPGGQGGAVKTFGEVKIAVFTAVNALGAIYDRQGMIQHGYFDQTTQTQLQQEDLLKQVYPLNSAITEELKPMQGNTTLSVVVINLDLSLYDRTSALTLINSDGERELSNKLV